VPLPVARELGDTSLMFIVHPTLTEDEINKTTQAISTVFELSQLK
jgi:dTDP-4-amino-4,6-dideoxygalactose transaminase